MPVLDLSMNLLAEHYEFVTLEQWSAQVEPRP